MESRFRKHYEGKIPVSPLDGRRPRYHVLDRFQEGLDLGFGDVLHLRSISKVLFVGMDEGLLWFVENGDNDVILIPYSITKYLEDTLQFYADINQPFVYTVGKDDITIQRLFKGSFCSESLRFYLDTSSSTVGLWLKEEKSIRFLFQTHGFRTLKETDPCLNSAEYIEAYLKHTHDVTIKISHPTTQTEEEIDLRGRLSHLIAPLYFTCHRDGLALWGDTTFILKGPSKNINRLRQRLVKAGVNVDNSTIHRGSNVFHLDL